MTRTTPEDLADFLGLLNELLGGGHYDWARETLEGIRTTVHTTGRVTEGQRQAVARIAAARRQARDDDRQMSFERTGGSRRYEGWEPRR